jgi:hypothetical protein
VTAGIVVTLDLALTRGGTTSWSRAVHVPHGSVVDIAVAGDDRVSTRRISVRRWAAELTETCRCVAHDRPAYPPDDSPDLPWELVVASGAALADRRAGLYAELLGRLDPAARAQLDRLHRGTVGRLRASGTAGRRVGRLSWVLVADGWRALTPYAVGGSAMVRLERRRPEDLARQVARWVAR